MRKLERKTALVTGATGGIGEAIAKALKEAGAQVAVSGTREDKLKEIAARLGGDTVIIPCDLSDATAVEGLIARVEEAIGGLDILVNNAGITRDALAMRMKDEDWDQVIAVNLTATFKLSRAAIKGMIKKRHGRIINVSSVVGTTGNPGQANYCASKAGIAGMSKALAAEVAARGITVNCIAPGFIATPMTEALSEQQRARILQNIPASRLGSPEDVAAAAAFLAGDDAAYITGQTLHVNGGLCMV